MKHNEFTTRTELKSLTRSIKCAETECGRLRMLKVCFGASSMCLGVPFKSPKADRSRWRHSWRQSCLLSGGAPDSPVCYRTATVHVRCTIFLPFLVQPTAATSGWLAHRTLFSAHRTVRCPEPTVGAGHASPLDLAADRCAGGHWLTGQSGAPPDCPMNYSHRPPKFSRE
jgi:hypothetical protein